MYSIATTNLLLWVLSCLVVRSMRKATRQNMHETDNAKKVYIYMYIYISIIYASVGNKIF